MIIFSLRNTCYISASSGAIDVMKIWSVTYRSSRGQLNAKFEIDEFIFWSISNFLFCLFGRLHWNKGNWVSHVLGIWPYILGLAIDSFTPGRRTGSSFFQILHQQSQQKMVLLSFVDIQKICIFTKFGRCSSKIGPAMPILILKFKRMWQTQFFSHTLQISYRLSNDILFNFLCL